MNFRIFLLIHTISVFQISCLKTIQIDKYKYISPKDFGAIGDGIANDSLSFSLAMIQAHKQRLPLFIPNGKYRVRLQLMYDSLEIIGESRPDTSMKSGVVILGLIDANFKRHTKLRNLGIDSRGQLLPKDDAALTSGADAANDPLYQDFSNITVVGDGYHDYKHGVLCFSGQEITLKNIHVVHFYHGIALRSSKITVDSAIIDYCGFTSVIAKADEGMNRVTEQISISNITINGDPADAYRRGGAVMVQSFSPSSITRNIKIENIVSNFGGVATVLVEQRNGQVSNVSIKNCKAYSSGDNPVRAAFYVQGGTGIHFLNCTARNATGIGYRAEGNVADVTVSNSFEQGAAITPWKGKFKYLELNGIVWVK
jgi:hypothetical protein